MAPTSKNGHFNLIKNIFIYNVGENILTSDSFPRKVPGIDLIFVFNDFLYHYQNQQFFNGNDKNKFYFNYIGIREFKDVLIPNYIVHLHMFQWENQRLHLTQETLTYINSNFKFVSIPGTTIELLKNNKKYKRIKNFFNISINQLIDGGVLSISSEEILIGSSNSSFIKLNNIPCNNSDQDNKTKYLYFTVFRNKFLAFEIFKNLFYKLNCKNSQKSLARGIANSINKGNLKKDEEEIIKTIQFIRENDFKNRNYFEFLFSNTSYRGGGGGGGGKEGQINFGDFNKWITIIVQCKNVVALQMYQLIFPENFNIQKKKIIELIKEKYLLNNSKYDLEFHLYLNEYFKNLVENVPMDNLNAKQIFTMEVTYRNDFEFLKNYASGLLEIVRNNKIKSNNSSLRGTSFEIDVIKNILLTCNLYFIEELFKANAIDAKKCCKIIFRSITNEKIMNLVFKYYKDLLFSANNFNYIYLKSSKLVGQYKILMESLNRKALVISFDEMIKNYEEYGVNQPGIFSLFLIALSNPEFYIINDEIKKSYFDNIHRINNFNIFIKMIKEAIKINSSIQVNGYFSPSISKFISNHFFKEINKGFLVIGKDSVELEISNGFPLNVFENQLKIIIKLIIPYHILCFCLIENDKMSFDLILLLNKFPAIFNKSLFIKIGNDLKFENSEIQSKFELLFNKTNLLN
ncbi:hypothetical protein ACTFIY_003021 [Dictyostelium cf. discoideum]